MLCPLRRILRMVSSWVHELNSHEFMVRFTVIGKGFHLWNGP